MEQLNDYIITLRQKKKQPNEDSILNILTSKMESLTKAKLDSQLNKIIKQQRIYNNLHCGNNSYYVCEQVDNLVPIEKPRPLALSKIPLKLSTVSLESPNAPSKILSAISLEKPFAEPLKSPKNTNTPQLFSETDFRRELSLMKDHIKTLETKNEAIKLFIKEQLYVIKKSISNIKNEETVNENVRLIEYLQKANEKLEQENDSKTTIIEILAKNKTSNIPTTPSNTEHLKLVKRKANYVSYKLKNVRKPEIKYPNRYETLYKTDSEKESNSSP